MRAVGEAGDDPNGLGLQEVVGLATEVSSRVYRMIVRCTFISLRGSLTFSNERAICSTTVRNRSIR